MKFQIDAPDKLEAQKVEVKNTTLEVTPVAVRGQHIVRAGYITAKGDGGNEAKAVILFNTHTGEFSLQRTDGDGVKFDFDMSKSDFKRKRDAAKRPNAAKTLPTVTTLPAQPAK